MTFVVCMNYAKYRLEEARRPKPFDKQKNFRPLLFCIQSQFGGDGVLPARDGSASVPSLPQSPAYRALLEAVAARTAMLEAKETEAKRDLECKLLPVSIAVTSIK